MTTVRDHLDNLAAADDLLVVNQRVHWDSEAAAIAGEASRQNGPAVLFENTPGDVRFVSGIYGGPDQLYQRNRKPWSRLLEALGYDRGRSYVDLIATIGTQNTESVDPNANMDTHMTTGTDLHSLGLPSVGTDSRPSITLGVLAATIAGETVWAPVRGEVRSSDRLQLVVPDELGTSIDDTAVSVVLGIPAAAVIATRQQWNRKRTGRGTPALAVALDDIDLARAAGGIVPSTAEIRIDGIAWSVDVDVSGPQAGWEQAWSTATLDVRTTEISTRQDPIVPFAPLAHPLTDDIHLASIIEAGKLYARVNNYWGIEPVEWILIPVETRLGICVVSTEILYAGFEWQLANTLFSFSQLFDKILILDADAEPTDLARAVDDMWIKAHPSHDWQFSESDAPAASAPLYRRDGITGSRMYINATWDPRWEEEYIAPRVTFETSYPEDIRTTVLEQWTDLGFEEEVNR